VRRSESLTVVVLCPHFERPIQATRQVVSERLVDCASKQECVTVSESAAGVTISVYPSGCPVFRAPAVR
jgi:hypothetical protein